MGYAEIAVLALSVIEKLAGLFYKARAAALRSGEWTPEQAAEFDARMEASFKEPHWQPEEETGGEG